MTSLEHVAAERAKLYSERTYWEGVRRNANLELQDAPRDNGAYTNTIEEQLKAQLATAIYQLDRIAQELNRLEHEREAQAREDAFKQGSQRENAVKEAERREQEAGQKERELKEESAKEERLKADAQQKEAQQKEAQQKEEQQKAEALEKERQEKEFFEKQERERLEALAKEERDKQELERQEIEKQEALKKEEMQQKEQQSELDYLGEQIAGIHEEWEYIQGQIAEEWEYIDNQIAEEWKYVVDQIAEEWDYVDKQIQEEMEYNVVQALGAVAEAGFEIGIAIANPVSQKEAGQYLEERKQALKDFISDEVFQAAPAETKGQWLEAKFKEQQQALEQEFGGRKDDWGNLKQMQDGLADLQKTLLDTVKPEQEIERKLNASIEDLKRVEAETKERLERANLDKEVLEQKLREVEELARKLEDQHRREAERECELIRERQQRLLEEIEERHREEMAREEARRRAEAARAMQDAFGI